VVTIADVNGSAGLAVTFGLSDLDRWSLREFGLLADHLDGDQLSDLATHVGRLAAQDREFWSGRDRRMQADHQGFELSGSYTPLGHDNKTEEELNAEDAQSVTLPDLYLFPSKLANMLVGAGIRLHMPASALNETGAVQKVENYARHWWVEATDRAMFAGGADPLRHLAIHDVLRGWITVLLLPDSSDTEFPYRMEIEDPLYVYPLFTRSGLARVTRQYQITAVEARREYPDEPDLFTTYDDTDEIQCTGYYDEIYHFILLEGKEYRSGSQVSRDRRMIGRPHRHGVRDFSGRPVNPWIIVVPLGNLSAPTRESKPDTRLYGPGVLHGVHEVYNHLCRVASMLLTQVGRSVDPPTITYIRDGKPIVEALSLARGARNYAWFQDSNVQVLDLAPNPGNLGPVLQLLQDRLNKVTLPSVFYGEAGAVTSGYGVGLLTNAAMDIIRPYARGLEVAVKLILRRMLEITYHVTASTHISLTMMAQQGVMKRSVTGIEFDPQVIGQTGVQLQVKLGEVTPQEKAAVAQYVMGLVGSGILPRYDARVELGYDDPLLMFQRQALESLLADPIIAQALGPLSAYNSDDELLLAALQVKQQMMTMAPGGEPQAGMPANMPNNVVPTELQNRAGQPPPGQSEAEGIRGDNALSIARWLEQFGGSPPGGGR